MRPLRRTRIVATLGPSSSEPATLRRMLEAGLDVARLNFSHGSDDDHRRLAAALRQAARRVGRDVAILGDLAGPKVRLGVVAGGTVDLARGAEVVLSARRGPGDGTTLPVAHRALPRDVQPGDPILIADGTVSLVVLAVRGSDVRCRVVDGGPVRSRAGVNLPRATVTASNPTAADRARASLALEIGVDALAQSFVRSAADVRRLKRLLKRLGAPDLPVVAKIEKPQAVEALDEILEAADGVMVARGDLGVECPPEDVPLHQKRIIALANERAKAVITATQMLESMIHEARPTRAEASDVANAILDGTDAVMLSAETATGEHPVAAVAMMASIARRIEASDVYRHAMAARRETLADLGDVSEAITRAARHAAEHLEAAALVVFSESGATAFRLARQRPGPPIIALSPDRAVLRRLRLRHGLQGLHVPRQRTTDRLVAAGLAAVRDAGLLPSGAAVVVVAGSSPLAAASNMLKVDAIP